MAHLATDHDHSNLHAHYAVEDTHVLHTQLVVGYHRRAAKTESVSRLLGRVGILELLDQRVPEDPLIVGTERSHLPERIGRQEHPAHRLHCSLDSAYKSTSGLSARQPPAERYAARLQPVIASEPGTGQGSQGAKKVSQPSA